MRRFLAACLLVVFAALAAGDAFACPDGCQCATSMAAAARCDTTGACVFCAAAAVVSVPPVTAAHFVVAETFIDLAFLASPLPPPTPPDHPPRVA